MSAPTTTLKTTSTTKTTTIEEILGGTHVQNRNGTKISLSDISSKNEVIGIYFSAHWCGPCRSFTPKFKQRYTNWIEKGKTLKVIFVSLDKNRESFDEYYRSMHDEWFAIPFNQNDRRKDINMRLNTNRSIPFLMFVDSKTGETHSKQGRTIVSKDPNGVDFPWKDYQTPYEPPNVWNRVAMRLLIFVAFFIFYRFYYNK